MSYDNDLTWANTVTDPDEIIRELYMRGFAHTPQEDNALLDALSGRIGPDEDNCFDSRWKAKAWGAYAYAMYHTPLLKQINKDTTPEDLQLMSEQLQIGWAARNNPEAFREAWIKAKEQAG